MRKCECGGRYSRHQVNYNKKGVETIRFRCVDCKKSISVRDGEIVNGKGPKKKDWRSIDNVELTGAAPNGQQAKKRRMNDDKRNTPTSAASG